MSDESYMIFAPNRTGALHIGNAMILALIADEAERLRIKVLEILDPIASWNTEYGDVDRDALARETQASLERANEYLHVPVADIFWRERRYSRYQDVAQKLVQNGSAVERPNGTIVLKNGACIEDETYGRIWDSGAIVMYRGEPWGSLVGVVDSVDFHVPVWIDDIGLMPDALDASALWAYIADCEPPRSIHVPTICDAEGRPLSKRSGVRAPYEFDAWARRYLDATARRAALRAMVSYWRTERLKILPVECVHVNAAGQRVGYSYLREIGQYENRELVT